MSDETLLAEALETINELQTRLSRMRSGGAGNGEGIAIIGMACRFPKAPNLKVFWQQLCEGFDAVGHYPESRLALLGITDEAQMRESRHIYGGYLEDIDLFDPALFNISRREANCMDPQQRLLLLCTHQALQDAGITGTPDFANTGVFVSHYASRYIDQRRGYDRHDALHIATGNAAAISANRISYCYDLHGPSLLVDTACSSTLAGVDIALHYLHSRRIDYAIVAGVSLNPDPHITRLLQDAGMLSREGKCKTFDAGADGYVPGEGVGAIVLQRLADAAARENRVYAVIAGCAINQDGRSNGLAAPNGLAQEMVIRQAFEQAGLPPASAQYIETHGTGTYLGDPVEIGALANVVGAGRNSGPCVLGCLKTNIGHLEPAAGIASLIKAALCLHRKAIPGNNHLRQVNPLLEREADLFTLPTQTRPWESAAPAGSSPGPERIAGVSSFGLGGVNGHLVLVNTPPALAAAKGDLLKTYPLAEFNLRSCWLKRGQPASGPTPQSNGAKAGFLDYRREDSPTEALRVSLWLDARQLPGILDTGNFHVGFYLETLYKLFCDHFQAARIHIGQIRFLHPLLISRSSRTRLLVLIDQRDEGYRARFFFRYEGGGESWLESARAGVTLRAAGEPPRIPEAWPPAGSAVEKVEATEFYRRYAAMGFPAAGYIRVVGSAGLAPPISRAQLLPGIDPAAYRLGAHPGFIDAALQPGLVMLDTQYKVPYMTTEMKDIDILGPLRPDTDYWLHNRILEVEGDGGRFYQTWRVCGADGLPVISCGRAALQRLAERPPADILPQVPPAELTPALVLGAIARELDCAAEEIDRDARLLELGMDSLMILRLQGLLDRYGLPVNNLFNISTQALLDLVENHGERRPEAVEPVPEERGAPVSLSDLRPHSMTPELWLPGGGKPDAAMRLYCFPYGVQSASVFRHWAGRLPDGIEVCPVELPGRGQRSGERPIESAFELAERLTRVMGGEIERPYAIYGHSAGALIGYVWCLHLQRVGKPLPSRLFAAAFSAPCLPENPVIRELRQLYRQHGVERMPSLRDITEPDNEAFVERVLDTLEADLRRQQLPAIGRELIRTRLHTAVAIYHLVAGFDRSDARPVPVPISALHGDRDTQVSLEDMRAWCDLTTEAFELRRFCGGHHFMDHVKNGVEVVNYIGEKLSGNGVDSWTDTD